MEEFFDILDRVIVIFYSAVSFLSYFWKIFLWPLIRNWGWLVLPFFLIRPFLFLWLWWRRELYSKNFKHVLLEIKLPKNILKPIKAMEDVFAGIWMIYDPPMNFREKWIEGVESPSLSLEICGINGEAHFYIRIDDKRKETIKSNIYSHYPEAEIEEVEDYTKKVPQDIPNKDWDLEGRDIVLRRPNPFPIKTYLKWETGTESLEEKRMDPLAKLLEGFANLKEGEQIWIQFIIAPITNDDIPWVSEGQKIRDILAKRKKEEKPPKSLLETIIDFFISTLKRAIEISWATIFEGKVPPEEQAEESSAPLEDYPPEMRLTPGEKEIIEEIERKISKNGFASFCRIVYLGKREVFFKPRLGIPFSFLGSFSTLHLNSLSKPLKQTSTKVKSNIFWWTDKRIAFLRKRRIFRKYIDRLPPFFPKPGGGFVLNTEELASLFHFPGVGVAPSVSVSRIEAKKEEAPPSLPIEE